MEPLPRYQVCTFILLIAHNFYIATSKQRSKYRKAIAENKKKVAKLVENYNKIIKNGSVITDETEVSEEDVISGCFPWSALTGNISAK